MFGTKPSTLKRLVLKVLGHMFLLEGTGIYMA